MKKIVLLAAIVLLGSQGIKAQDTVYSIWPDSSYFIYEWTTLDTNTMFMERAGLQNVSDKVFGKGYFSYDTLTVYGIATSVRTFDMTIDEMYRDPVTGEYDSTGYYAKLNDMCDTSWDDAYELWGIYMHEGDSLRLASPELRLNIKTTPVAYYQSFGTRSLLDTAKYTPPFPFYELYFDEPQTVVGEFYLASTNRIGQMAGKCSSDHYVPFYTWPHIWNVVTPYRATWVPQHEAWYEGWGPNPKWVFWTKAPSVLLVFPILEPGTNGDTIPIPHGGDTAAVEQVLLQRTTLVTPNPTSTMARVVSGVGLTRVEAYDVAGAKVTERDVVGNETTLDVSGWPAGTYLLRLTTPVGTVTKKLVVQRR